MTEAVISSSILIAIIILIRTVFKGKLRSSVRYALWLIAATRLMLPFSLVQSPISVMNAAETVISVNQADEIVKPTEAELYIPESIAEQTLNEASPMNVEKASPKEVRTAVRRAVTAVMLLWFCAVNVRFYLLLRKTEKRSLMTLRCEFTQRKSLHHRAFSDFSDRVFTYPKALQRTVKRWNTSLRMRCVIIATAT